MRQYNVLNQVFDDLLEDGTTNGEGWHCVTDDQINAISASITGGGEVWVDNGQIKISGAAPNMFSRFDKATESWQICPDKQKAYYDEQRLKIRAEINAKRDECVDGGAYVAKINKWVDSDEKGRATLVEIKADFDINGKDNTYTLICADNSTHQLTYDDFRAVWGAVKTLKESMFENAYMHKVLLEQAADPTAYDWSIGWSETYEDHLAKSKAKE